MKILVRLSAILGSKPTESEFSGTALAEEVYDALVREFNDIASNSDEDIAADDQPMGSYAEHVTFGAVDADTITSTASGWFDMCVSSFKASLTQVLGGDSVKDANIKLDTTNTFELLKATAVIDNSYFELFADYGVYLSEIHGFRHLPTTADIKRVLEDPADYAVVELDTN